MELSKILEGLLDLATKRRDAMLRIPFVGDYLYNDFEQKYSPIQHHNFFMVRDPQSLLALLEQVLSQLSPDISSNGNEPVIVFTPTGADLYPSRYCESKHAYVRQSSWQYQEVLKIINRHVSHVTLLETLKTIRGSVVDYPTVSRSLGKVILTEKSSIVSSPIHDEDTGEKIKSQSLTVTVAGGQNLTVRLPQTITFEVPLFVSSVGKALIEAEISVGKGKDMGCSQKSEEPFFFLRVGGIQALEAEEIQGEFDRMVKSINDAGLMSSVVVLRNF